MQRDPYHNPRWVSSRHARHPHESSSWIRIHRTMSWNKIELLILSLGEIGD